MKTKDVYKIAKEIKINNPGLTHKEALEIAKRDMK